MSGFRGSKNRLITKQKKLVVVTHRIGKLSWRNNITAEGFMASYNASGSIICSFFVHIHFMAASGHAIFVINVPLLILFFTKMENQH